MHVHGGGLVNHCHGMGFVELDELHGHGNDANELEEDLHPKKSAKNVDLSGSVLNRTKM